MSAFELYHSFPRLSIPTQIIHYFNVIMFILSTVICNFSQCDRKYHVLSYQHYTERLRHHLLSKVKTRQRNAAKTYYHSVVHTTCKRDLMFVNIRSLFFIVIIALTLRRYVLRQFFLCKRKHHTLSHQYYAHKTCGPFICAILICD